MGFEMTSNLMGVLSSDCAGIELPDLEARPQFTMIGALFARHIDGPPPWGRVGANTPRPTHAAGAAGHLRDKALGPRRA